MSENSICYFLLANDINGNIVIKNIGKKTPKKLKKNPPKKTTSDAKIVVIEGTSLIQREIIRVY